MSTALRKRCWKILEKLRELMRELLEETERIAADDGTITLES